MLFTANILFAAALLGIGWLLLQQHRINHVILMNQAEALAALVAIKAQNAKVFTEVSAKLTELTGKIAQLEEQITNGALPEEIANTITEIKTGLQLTDDLIPDAPAA